MAMDAPLKLYWNEPRGDDFTVATPQGEQDALAAGDSFVRVEGYILRAPRRLRAPREKIQTQRR
jgi:hypothetical protein